MIRNTSREAYEKIKANGLLSERRMQVYDVLYVHGPLTQNETWKLVQEKYNPEISKQSINPRFAEMELRTVVEVVGSKCCSVTKQKCLLWDVTPNLPADPGTAVKKGRKENTEEMQAKIDKLKVELDSILAQASSDLYFNSVPALTRLRSLL